MKKILVLIAITTNLIIGNSQNLVKIDKLDSLNNSIYSILSDYNLIMIGEMHGTNEPVEFLTKLAELFVNNGDIVQVGFEIPADLMQNYLQNQTDSSIYNSEFFKINIFDGRASIAWANAISTLTKNPKIKLFFYDVDRSKANIDSLMYINIKNKLIENPNWRTITISGNVHNKKIPHKEQYTTAYYLCNDEKLNNYKICSLNHEFQKGTMLNYYENGLELREVNYGKSPNAPDYDNYLYLYPESFVYPWNGVFFTKIVTASELVNKKTYE